MHTESLTNKRNINMNENLTTYRTDNVNRFFADINRYPVIEKGEQINLAIAAQNGDENARQTLLNSNLRFAFSIAKQYAKGDAVLEITSVATIGMDEAIASYDATIGVGFLTYAVRVMRTHISEYIKETAETVVNKAANRLGSKANRASEKFFGENGRMPSEDELIEIIEREYNTVVEGRHQLVKHSISSLDATIDEDGTTTAEVGEIATATATTNEIVAIAEAEDNAYKVDKLLSTLPIRERTILEMSFGLGEYEGREYEDEAIGEAIGLTGERVRQIRKRVLGLLKDRAARILVQAE